MGDDGPDFLGWVKDFFWAYLGKDSGVPTHLRFRRFSSVYKFLYYEKIFLFLEMNGISV